MERMRKQRVFVGLSGGVDSSVAAALLMEAGYEVTGCHLRCFNVDGCAERDADDARRVAEQLGIPFYAFDFEEEYKKRVVRPMVEEYAAGTTPNPDVLCNREIKFGLFFKRAMELGADAVATGHYVRRFLRTDGSYALAAAADRNKDQSYFLWTLGQEEIDRSLFPLGEMLKSQVREKARALGLITAEKKDSQGICFLGKVTLPEFLSGYMRQEEGAVLASDGTRLGTHRGAGFYTPGQRHGVGIGGSPKPLYVTKKDVAENTLTVAERDAAPHISEIKLENMNMMNSSFLISSVMVRIRYRQPLVPATIAKDAAGEWTLHLETSQPFVAPGQSAVFYAEDGEMLGGGIIA